MSIGDRPILRQAAALLKPIKKNHSAILTAPQQTLRRHSSLHMTKHALPTLMVALAAATTHVATAYENQESMGSINSIDRDRLLHPGCTNWTPTENQNPDEYGVYTSGEMEHGVPPLFEVGDAYLNTQVTVTDTDGVDGYTTYRLTVAPKSDNVKNVYTICEQPYLFATISTQ